MSYQRPTATPPVLKALFPTTARRAVVELLFSGAPGEASMSELARRAGLTPRAVAVEVQKLEEAGLVEVQAFGSAHVVRRNQKNPASRALSELVRAARDAASGSSDRNVRRSLAAFGAPLAGEEPRAAFSLAETLVRALKMARHDATVLRVLPVVLAKRASELDWTDLMERAHRMNVRSELGMLLDLTAEVAHLPNLRARTKGLRDARRKRPRYFPSVEGTFEKQLAATRTPEAASRWLFMMNMTEESFREMVSKHVASAPLPTR
ncbi:helix-turn-helix domain-containing protein [Anaeromyxobacter oryzisoli]|uniref:helix-turn-helix domain-containing protein n=1 Tax=Anaeromyxobacter oryzisoli TaxID=2925408 RepID=UPI001F55CB08|nr:helix-turn-helix domain-containing protein [Anaeromyxobacter sp. SG63]